MILLGLSEAFFEEAVLSAAFCMSVCLGKASHTVTAHVCHGDFRKGQVRAGHACTVMTLRLKSSEGDRGTAWLVPVRHSTCKTNESLSSKAKRRKEIKKRERHKVFYKGKHGVDPVVAGLAVDQSKPHIVDSHLMRCNCRGPASSSSVTPSRNSLLRCCSRSCLRSRSLMFEPRGASRNGSTYTQQHNLSKAVLAFVTASQL